MRERVDKIIKFIRNNYKLIIPILLMIVLFVAFFIFYMVSIYDKTRIDTKGKFYQYYYGEKYEYNGVVSTNRRDVIIDFKTSDYDIKFDSTPIYYSDKKKVIFPKDMSVVMPTLNCSEYLSKAYSYITENNNKYVLTTKNYNNNLGHYFLFDGDDLYFFIDDVKLKVGNEEIELSPMSYVIAKYGEYVSYYDNKSDTYKNIKTEDTQGTISNDYFTIYISLDRLDYFGTDVIITGGDGISNLNTIDKKENNRKI